MIIKQTNYNNYIIRLLKFKNIIALDYFNFDMLTGLFLKTFDNSEEEKAKEFFNNLDEQKISKLLEACNNG